MHCNENAGRDQKRNQQGELEFAVSFPKHKQGGYTIRKILKDCTYNYTDQLFCTLLDILKQGNFREQVNNEVPPPLCASFVKPNKAQTVEEHASRFK